MEARRVSTFPGAPSNGANSDALVRDAFRRRAGHAIDHIARAASVEALTDALSAGTDFGAVARALGDSAAFAAALPLDPLTDSLARGAAERERLAAKAEGLLSAEAVGQALGGLSRQAVDKRRRNKQLLAVRIGGDWRYPAVQFGPDGETVSGLAAVIEEMSDLGPWALLDFLLAEDSALGGISPLEALRRGGHAADTVHRIVKAHTTDAYG